MTVTHPSRARAKAASSWAMSSLMRHYGESDGQKFWAAQAASDALQAIVMEETCGLWEPEPLTVAAARRLAREN